MNNTFKSIYISHFNIDHSTISFSKNNTNIKTVENQTFYLISST